MFLRREMTDVGQASSLSLGFGHFAVRLCRCYGESLWASAPEWPTYLAAMTYRDVEENTITGLARGVSLP